MIQQEKQTDAQIIEEAIHDCVKFEDFHEELLRCNPGLDCVQVATAYRETPMPQTIRFGRYALTQADYDKVDQLDGFPGAGLRDISAITNLRNLQFLDLSENPIQDFSPLACLERLEWLYLEKTGIQDLSVLAGLKNLEVLSLVDNPFTDYTPLFGLTKLEVLDIRLCNEDWKAIEELEIALPNCGISHHYYYFDDD
jgi:hypothetical protein